jgi:hypothetical protein
MNNFFLLTALIFNFNANIFNSDEGLSFVNTTIDYGTIDINSNGKKEFEYVNNSKKSLFITKVSPSCSCVVVKYNENEIRKGEKGHIEVNYDTQRLGFFTKIISVSTSASNEIIILTIKGNVQNN